MDSSTLQIMECGIGKKNFVIQHKTWTPICFPFLENVEMKCETFTAFAFFYVTFFITFFLTFLNG